MTFKPSKYQEDIFDFIRGGLGDGMVSAVAGSGKTSTLVMGAQFVRRSEDSVFLAFNKHIADELGVKLSATPMKAKTIHSLGYGILARSLGKLQSPDNFKYQNIGKEVLLEQLSHLFPEGERSPLFREFAKVLAKLTDLSRLTLAKSMDEIMALAGEHAITMSPTNLSKLVTLVPEVLSQGAKAAEESCHIDYTDMIYLPIRMSLPVPLFDRIFVDEAQDLSACQRELVLLCRRPGGRLLAVGDERQAIMGFAGADADSYHKIAEVTDATILPLSICYRCPAKHIRLAKSIVPEIEAAPDAVEGEILFIDDTAMLQYVTPHMLVICRTTAPLVSACIAMIRNKIAARVRGRDIAAMLTNIVEKAGKRTEYKHFLDALDNYQLVQTDLLSRHEGNEEKLILLDDTCEAIAGCYTEFTTCKSYLDLIKEINAIFSETEGDVTLSTVHRAKGLEADVVMILRPEKLPLTWPKQTSTQYIQEMNLTYVAYTRAKETLIFVRDTSKDGGEIHEG